MKTGTQACLSPNGVDMYRLAARPDALLIATMDGVIELGCDAGSERWQVKRQTLKGHHVGSLMLAPGRGAVFAGAHGTGLYRSVDGAASWQPVIRGLSAPHVFSLAFDQRGEDVALYAGTEPAKLFKSVDAGDSWSELPGLATAEGNERWNFPAPPHIAHVKHIVADPRDPATLYVCIEQGALLKSTDGGISFKELMFEDERCIQNRDTHRIVFNPLNSDEIYVDGGDGLFRSSDAGGTWQRLTDANMGVAYPDHLYLDPENPLRMFMAGGGTAPNVWRATGNARSSMLRSEDGGVSWGPLAGGLPDELPGNIEAATMVMWPDGYGFFLGTSDGEVYCSLDKGDSWKLIAADLTPISKCVHFRNLSLGRAFVAASQAPI